jgi:hypothetical protein
MENNKLHCATGIDHCGGARPRRYKSARPTRPFSPTTKIMEAFSPSRRWLPGEIRSADGGEPDKELPKTKPGPRGTSKWQMGGRGLTEDRSRWR